MPTGRPQHLCSLDSRMALLPEALTPDPSIPWTRELEENVTLYAMVWGG